MQEGYNRPSFGTFILRVAVVALGLFLLGFIVWGVMKLADSSDFGGDLARILGFVFVPLLIIGGIILLLRFLSSRSVSINIARVLSIIIGLLILGFIVWGITRLASTDDEGTVSVVDDSSSTVTIDEPEVEPGTDENDSAADDSSTDESATDEETAPADQPATDETNNDESTATPNTGPRPETTPNTGIESILLPAISLGALAYAAKSYKQSRAQLKQI